MRLPEMLQKACVSRWITVWMSTIWLSSPRNFRKRARYSVRRRAWPALKRRAIETCLERSQRVFFPRSSRGGRTLFLKSKTVARGLLSTICETIKCALSLRQHQTESHEQYEPNHHPLPGPNAQD